MSTDRLGLAWLRLAHSFPAESARIAALRSLEPDLGRLGDRLARLIDGDDEAFADLRFTLPEDPAYRPHSAGFACQLRSTQGLRGAERAMAWADKHSIRHLLTPADARYPDSLRALYDLPPMLAVTGQLDAFDLPGVSMVGSRHASRVGLATARRFAEELSGLGLSVVSGLALGIDAAAHRGALDNGGVTLALSATGPDRIYPSTHRALAHEIIERGAVITEYPLGEGIHRKRFPERNRLIAALGYGVVVIEAGRRSGTLTTAGHAAVLGKPVMPVPGNIANPCNSGSHDLIRDGASLVENTAEIAALLAPAMGLDIGRPLPAATVASSDELDTDARHTLACLDADGMGLDALCDVSTLPPGKVLAAVSRLEMAGLLERLPHGGYARCLR